MGSVACFSLCLWLVERGIAQFVKALFLGDHRCPPFDSHRRFLMASDSRLYSTGSLGVSSFLQFSVIVNLIERGSIDILLAGGARKCSPPSVGSCWERKCGVDMVYMPPSFDMGKRAVKVGAGWGVLGRKTK